MNYPEIILKEEGKRAVSARLLHEKLGVGTDFTNWCKRMFEYGYEQGVDFTPNLAKSTGGRPSIDYIFSLDMAKEVCMIQRSEIGRSFRKYFIECEKQLQANTQPESKNNNPLLTPAIQVAIAYFEKSKTDYMTSLEANQVVEPTNITRYHLGVALRLAFGKSVVKRFGSKVKRVYQIKPIV
jgi:phage anti-repressor protein